MRFLSAEYKHTVIPSVYRPIVIQGTIQDQAKAEIAPSTVMKYNECAPTSFVVLTVAPGEPKTSHDTEKLGSSIALP
jgi:hypothetical protein